MRTIILLLLMCSVAFAAPPVKPNIPSNKLLDLPEQAQVKDYLWENQKIHKRLTPAKNDYVSHTNRGTVHFTTELRKNGRPLHGNYVYYKAIIPNGTTIKETNFGQREPHTVAIVGKDLTFIKCNLINVELDPTWTLIDCNNIQKKDVLLSIDEDSIDYNGNPCRRLYISHQIEKDGKFVEVDVEETTVGHHDDITDFMYMLHTE